MGLSLQGNGSGVGGLSLAPLRECLEAPWEDPGGFLFRHILGNLQQTVTQPQPQCLDASSGFFLRHVGATEMCQGPVSVFPGGPGVGSGAARHEDSPLPPLSQILAMAELHLPP